MPRNIELPVHVFQYIEGNIRINIPNFPNIAITIPYASFEYVVAKMKGYHEDDNASEY